MHESESGTASHEIVVYNDNSTPNSFVERLISEVFGLPKYETLMLAHRIRLAGEYAFGPYPESIAQVMLDEAMRRIAEAGHSLAVEKRDLSKPAESAYPSCSFCGKSSTEVHKLIAGKGAHICDACVATSAGELHDELPSARLRFAYELLDWHFGDVSPDKFVKTGRTYPGRVRADLQGAIESFIGRRLSGRSGSGSGMVRNESISRPFGAAGGMPRASRR